MGHGTAVLAFACQAGQDRPGPVLAEDANHTATRFCLGEVSYRIANSRGAHDLALGFDEQTSLYQDGRLPDECSG